MTAPLPPLSALGEQVRRQDGERFVTTLFADPAARADLWLLYAFNAELAQVRTQVRQPLAGLIRLQWWREVVEGGRRQETVGHPLAAALQDLIVRRELPTAPLQAMVEARERDLEPVAFDDVPQWLAYGRDGAGALTHLACVVLGAECPAASAAGTAWALTALLRSVPIHLGQGWLTLPRQSLEAAGLGTDTVLAGKADRARLAGVVLDLVAQAQAQLAAARRHRAVRRVLPALLPAVQAAIHLRRIRAGGGNLFDERLRERSPMPLRLAWAAVRGRL